tara:strand:+ start:499 stop:1479 length:981 start_codon:yes stop_codon:yes gene_type:complete
MDNPESPNVFPIDIVITWVDTTDKAWINRYENTLNKPFKRSERWSPQYSPPDTELSLCLKLIRKNMAWVRNVFIVTQQQDPKCRTENEILIDHSDMGLGLVFNSLAIETSLYKIPGLSEHFIYFNDDIYAVKKLARSLFFTNNGATVVQFKDQYFGVDSIWGRTNKHTLKIYRSNNSHIVIPHVPYTLTKSQMTDAENLFPELWEQARKSLVRGSDGEINPILGTYINSVRNFTAILDTTSNLKYLYSDYAIDYLMYNHWFNIYPPHIVCINNFNTTKKELYDSIEKTSDLYIKLALYLIILTIIVTSIYKYTYKYKYKYRYGYKK